MFWVVGMILWTTSTLPIMASDQTVCPQISCTCLTGPGGDLTPFHIHVLCFCKVKNVLKSSWLLRNRWSFFLLLAFLKTENQKNFFLLSTSPARDCLFSAFLYRFLCSLSCLSICPSDKSLCVCPSKPFGRSRFQVNKNDEHNLMTDNTYYGSLFSLITNCFSFKN